MSCMKNRQAGIIIKWRAFIKNTRQREANGRSITNTHTVCLMVALKCDIAENLRKAYHEGNKEYLEKCANELLPVLSGKVKDLRETPPRPVARHLQTLRMGSYRHSLQRHYRQDRFGCLPYQGIFVGQYRKA